MDYYTNAGEDYAAWSPGLNMHFGLWRKGLNPLKLEPMLEAMNQLVLESLALSGEQQCRVADLGCGIGATLRHLAAACPRWNLHGVTLVPWQIHRAKEMLPANLAERVTFRRADYRDTGYPDAHFDAVYLLESACHDVGPDKSAVLAEACRILKPGGRLVIVDGFLKKSDCHPAWFRSCLRRMYAGWVMEGFPAQDAVLTRLDRTGFCDVEIRDLFWRVAPSGLHVPGVTLAYLWRRVRARTSPWSAESRRHVVSCALSPVVGLARPWFGYSLLTARKPWKMMSPDPR